MQDCTTLLPLTMSQTSLWSKSRQENIAQPRQLGCEAWDPPAEPGKGGTGTEGRGRWVVPGAGTIPQPPRARWEGSAAAAAKPKAVLVALDRRKV